MSENKNEIRMISNTVRELAKLSENASLTGAMEDGRGRAILRYNKAVARLQELGAIPDGMYDALPESSSYGELAVEARLLAATANGKSDNDQEKMIMRLAPFASSEDLSKMLRKNLETGKCCDEKTMVALAPFLKQEDLGEMIQAYCGCAEVAVVCNCNCEDCKNGNCCCGTDCDCCKEGEACHQDQKSTEITSDIEVQVRDIAQKLADPATTPEDKEALARELSALSQRMI